MIVPDKYVSPALIDKHIQNAQTALEGLSWLEYVYPLVKYGVTEDGKGFPVVYRNDGSKDNYQVLPDNDVKSFAFFKIEGDVGVYKLDSLGAEVYMEIPCSVTVWGRLDKMDVSDRSYDYTSELIEDVMYKLLSLPNSPGNDIFDVSEVSYSQNTRSVFGDFDALWDSAVNEQSYMQTNTFFKIDFNIRTDLICLV